MHIGKCKLSSNTNGHSVLVSGMKAMKMRRWSGYVIHHYWVEKIGSSSPADDCCQIFSQKGID